MIRAAIAGAGRMGQAIAALIEARDDMALAGVWRRGDDLDGLLRDRELGQELGRHARLGLVAGVEVVSE